ncbi:MAG: hypothetical protein E7569_16070 [Ruminococcaceae bacterium]|nr:hypothetical protein [Oscillospiraceae bacterium]
MKARIPPRKMMNGPSKKVVQSYIDDKESEILRRCLKLAFFTLNREYGFGATRLENVYEKTLQFQRENKSDPIFWEHLDRVLIQEIKLKIPPEDYAAFDDD